MSILDLQDLKTPSLQFFSCWTLLLIAALTYYFVMRKIADITSKIFQTFCLMFIVIKIMAMASLMYVTRNCVEFSSGDEG
jgi:hypothetical protein